MFVLLLMMTMITTTMTMMMMMTLMMMMMMMMAVGHGDRVEHAHDWPGIDVAVRRSLSTQSPAAATSRLCRCIPGDDDHWQHSSTCYGCWWGTCHSCWWCCVWVSSGPHLLSSVEVICLHSLCSLFALLWSWVVVSHRMWSCVVVFEMLVTSRVTLTTESTINVWV